MKLIFDSEGTCNCPMKGVSTKEECMDCIYFKMRFVDTWRGKKMELICVQPHVVPEPEDMFVGVK